MGYNNLLICEGKGGRHDGYARSAHESKTQTKQKGSNTPDFLPKHPDIAQSIFTSFYQRTHEVYLIYKGQRHHRHPSPGNHVRRFELTLSAGCGRARNPRGNGPRPLSTGRMLPLSLSSDLRRSSLRICVEAPRLPAAFFNDCQNQDPGTCSVVGPRVYVKKT